VHEVPHPVGLDESGVSQDPKVLGDSSRRDADEPGERAHAQRATREKMENLPTLLYAKRPEDPCGLRESPLLHDFSIN